MGMRGICSPIRLPICNPDKAVGTRPEEEEASGFTAGSLPVERAHVDESDTPPSVDTLVLSPHTHTK